MSDTDKDKSEYLDAWRGFKKEHPALYTGAAMLPVTGQVAAVADYADAMERGDTEDAVIASASFIPGFRLAKHASKLAPASLRLKSQMNVVERAIAPATKHAGKIGTAADAQQGYEAGIEAGEHIKSEEAEAKERRERDRHEYAVQWADRG